MILCVSLLVFAGLLMMQRRSFLHIILGLILLGNGVNLSIFVASNPDVGLFAFVGADGSIPYSNDPLPQALVLTAIVIGFALTAFLVALVKKLSTRVGDFDAPSMRWEENREEEDD